MFDLSALGYNLSDTSRPPGGDVWPNLYSRPSSVRWDSRPPSFRVAPSDEHQPLVEPYRRMLVAADALSFFSDDAPEKSSKFPLPPVSASQAHAFQLFVQKAKPLRRAMATLKEAMTALNAGDARGAVYLSIQAAVLAGRGSAAVPKLAARIMEAAAEIAKKAIGQGAAMADWFLPTQTMEQAQAGAVRMVQHGGGKEGAYPMEKEGRPGIYFPDVSQLTMKMREALGRRGIDANDVEEIMGGAGRAGAKGAEVLRQEYKSSMRRSAARSVAGY